MDTKKEDTDAKTALRHQQYQCLVSMDLDLALYFRCPYMGQWTWLMTRWKDCSPPSGPSESRRWTPIL